jgi:DHA3 family tetracycline resistance protein-like MFS transporter
MKLFTPLRLRGFRVLWAAMAFSLIGDGLALVAIAWQVYQLSDVPTALGVTMMAMSIPHILLLPLGGVISDRVERRRLLLAADAVRCAALAALGALSLGAGLQLWHMIVFAALYGAGNAFFGPAFDAIVPELVPQELLAQANSLDQFVRPVASRLAGPAIGGWIVSAAGPGWAFLANAATFLLSMACLLVLGAKGAAPRTAPDRDRPLPAPSPWNDALEGLRYVRSNAWLWGTFVAATLAYFVFLGPSEVLLPYLVKHEMGADAGDLGMVYAAGGLGAVAAAAAMAQRGLPRRNMTFVFACWGASTLAIAGYGFARSTWQAMLVCFVFNGLESAGLIVWLTTRQSLVPARLLGRVASLEWLIATALMPVSYALAGPVSAYLGARATLIGAGILGSALTLAFLLLPGIRSVEAAAVASGADTAAGTALRV